MSGHLRLVYDAPDSVSNGSIRDVLAGITDDDISNTSPVTPGVPEASVQVHRGMVVVEIDGHGHEWTKTSEQAIRNELGASEVVDELIEAEGGYDG